MICFTVSWWCCCRLGIFVGSEGQRDYIGLLHAILHSRAIIWLTVCLDKTQHITAYVGKCSSKGRYLFILCKAEHDIKAECALRQINTFGLMMLQLRVQVKEARLFSCQRGAHNQLLHEGDWAEESFPFLFFPFSMLYAVPRGRQ